MSKILALDTSTHACSVALNYHGRVVETFLDVPREHTQRLLPMVDEILARHQLRLQDVDAIAFGRGPGSFTGLRICLSTVQGLAFGADLPVVPVSTLKTMAAGAARLLKLQSGQPLLAALDARMEQIYWGLFAVENGQTVALTDEYVNFPADLATHPVLTRQQHPVTGIGPGWRYEELRKLAIEKIFPDCEPHAYDIAVIAEKCFQSGEAISVLDAQPVYLREEVAWQKRRRKRQSPA